MTRFVVSTVAVLVGLVGPAAAQTPEFTIPTEYDLIPGRLSVTFADTVTEARARRIIGMLGYEVVESHYQPLKVTATSNEPLPPAQQAALEQQPELIKLQIETLADERPRYHVTLHVDPTVPEDLVPALLAPIPQLALVSIQAYPHELTIGVDEASEDAAFEQLSAHPSVAYVAYIVANQ